MDIEKWITHILALLFSIVLLGLVAYTLVFVEDLEVAKAAMAFSAGILGAIIGFYFNLERLVSENRARERMSQAKDEIEAEFSDARNDFIDQIQGIRHVLTTDTEDEDNDQG
jgi:uncharacterized membrane protein YqgA involved in biofilm formation